MSKQVRSSSRIRRQPVRYPGIQKQDNNVDNSYSPGRIETPKQKKQAEEFFHLAQSLLKFIRSCNEKYLIAKREKSKKNTLASSKRYSPDEQGTEASTAVNKDKKSQNVVSRMKGRQKPQDEPYTQRSVLKGDLTFRKSQRIQRAKQKQAIEVEQVASYVQVQGKMKKVRYKPVFIQPKPQNKAEIPKMQNQKDITISTPQPKLPQLSSPQQLQSYPKPKELLQSQPRSQLHPSLQSQSQTKQIPEQPRSQAQLSQQPQQPQPKPEQLSSRLHLQPPLQSPLQPLSKPQQQLLQSQLRSQPHPSQQSQPKPQQIPEQPSQHLQPQILQQPQQQLPPPQQLQQLQPQVQQLPQPQPQSQPRSQPLYPSQNTQNVIMLQHFPQIHWQMNLFRPSTYHIGISYHINFLRQLQGEYIAEVQQSGRQFLQGNREHVENVIAERVGQEQASVNNNRVSEKSQTQKQRLSIKQLPVQGQDKELNKQKEKEKEKQKQKEIKKESEKLDKQDSASREQKQKQQGQ